MVAVLRILIPPGQYSGPPSSTKVALIANQTQVWLSWSLFWFRSNIGAVSMTNGDNCFQLITRIPFFRNMILGHAVLCNIFHSCKPQRFFEVTISSEAPSGRKCGFVYWLIGRPLFRLLITSVSTFNPRKSSTNGTKEAAFLGKKESMKPTS